MTTTRLVGPSHNHAPFEVLERACSAIEAVAGTARSDARESVPLVTCNRAELFLEADEEVTRRIVDALAANGLRSHLYVLEGMDAITHTMRAAAGVDSLIVGEVEILGQFARALEAAQARTTAGPVLTRLFRAAIGAGRRARSETEISRHTTSVSHAAAQLVLGGGARESAATVALVVGAGEAAELAARALRDRGVQQIHCTSRTEAHARDLATRVGCRWLAWEDMGSFLVEADVVLAATSAPFPVIRVGDVETVLDARRGRPLAIVDLAMPKDVESAVDRLPGVRRFGFDDLRSIVDGNIARRRAAVPAVEAIVADEAERLRQWLDGPRVVPPITAPRQRVAPRSPARTGPATRR